MSPIACYICQKKAHFTFNWTIENGYGLTTSRALLSPKFVIQSMGNTKWRLCLRVGPGAQAYTIHMQRKDNGSDSIEIEYELSFLAADGSPFAMETYAEKFSGMHESENTIIRGIDQIFDQRADCLPKDTLNVRCRMWRTGIEISKTDTCFARTRLSVDRRSFVWAIRQFSNLQLEQRVTHFLSPSSNSFPKVSLNIFLSERKGKKYLVFEIDKHSEENAGFHFGKFSLLDSDGRVAKLMGKNKPFLIFPHEHLEFNQELIEIEKILEDETSLLKDDVLYLNCEILLNVNIVSNQIEHYRSSNIEDIEPIVSDISEGYLDQSHESFTDNCPFKKVFEDLYLNENFSDIILRADGKTLNAHKIVLSTRSPVFKTLMTQDLPGNCVDIPDMNADTLDHLLLYIYKDIVPDLHWEKAMDLFKAADTYQLLDLRKKCSFILKSSFSVGNVCNIISFANILNDGELLNAAENFISQHDNKVLKSDEWKKFKEENFQLAFEVMERIVNNRINYENC